MMNPDFNEDDGVWLSQGHASGHGILHRVNVVDGLNMLRKGSKPVACCFRARGPNRRERFRVCKSSIQLVYV